MKVAATVKVILDYSSEQLYQMSLPVDELKDDFIKITNTNFSLNNVTGILFDISGARLSEYLTRKYQNFVDNKVTTSIILSQNTLELYTIITTKMEVNNRTCKPYVTYVNVMRKLDDYDHKEIAPVLTRIIIALINKAGK